jgi:predicted nucleic acid-binding protein
VEFADTNILIYAASLKAEDWNKAQAAQSLLAGDIAISLQVLQEFYVVARNPRKLNLTHQEAVRFCRQWRQFTMVVPSLDLFDESLRLCDRFRISYYDAALLAAAR